MNTIQQFFYNLLAQAGVPAEESLLLDNVIILVLIGIFTFLIDYSCRNVLIKMFKKLAKKTNNPFDDLIVDRRIIHKLMHIVPGILMYMMLPLAYSPTQTPLLQKFCLIYIIIVSVRFINSSLNLIHEIYDKKEMFKDKPLRGFIQIFQVIFFFIGAILIISVLINKSLTTLFTGLGASAAILMLVFKDTILGFVAGIQLSANDMLRVGDRITMEKYGANGIVEEVTLNTVKIRNFDNTIITIPPYSLVSDAFQNWRIAREIKNRRIKKSLFIDMRSVRFCTPEMLKEIYAHPLLAEAFKGNETSVASTSEMPTNLELFRHYALYHLEHLPEVNKEMIFTVRNLQPTQGGLPIEIYCFAEYKDWVTFQANQSKLLEHLLAILPAFRLNVFQNVSGSDIVEALQHEL